MARYSPLSDPTATTTEVENIDETAVVAELEHVFGENPAAANGEEHPASPGARDTLSEGVSDNENSRTYYFGSSTITVDKNKEMEEKGYFPVDEAHTRGAEMCQSRITMKLWCTRTFLSLAYACLRIQPWLIFYCISRRNCIN
jgi:hypothetical protein